ncbi:MAG: PaaI family thioesterase [Rhodopseudomonas sp.]|nr:PaaI family thioesterase [Rhodopseudomonas sp.]
MAIAKKTAIQKMSVAELESFLHLEFPQAFKNGDISIETADGSTSLLRQRYSEQMLRPGGTVSGPTLMALADFAMYVVLLSAIGPVGLAVTTNLNINFLRKGQPGQDVVAAARLLKLGKRLAVGEVLLLSGTSPDPIAHVTSTYSIPNV